MRSDELDGGEVAPALAAGGLHRPHGTLFSQNNLNSNVAPPLSGSARCPLAPPPNVIELLLIPAPLRRVDRRALRNAQQFAFSF